MSFDIAFRWSFGQFGSIRIIERPLQPTEAHIAWGSRGIESIEATIPANALQAIDLYRNIGQLFVEVMVHGRTIGRARVEEVRVGTDVVVIRALGLWRELSDYLYSGLWSNTGVDGWFVVSRAYNPSMLTNREPELYRIEMTNVIRIMLTRGTTYVSHQDVAAVAFRIPHRSSRTITVAQFTLRYTLPTSWRFLIARWDDDFSTVYGVPLEITSASPMTRAIYIEFAGAETVELQIFSETTQSPTGQTGVWFVEIGNLRIASTTETRVNTTLTAARSAGTSVTATVGSTANMFAGMSLVINSNASNSEMVTVIAVTSATTFTATFANSHSAGEAVQGICVRPDAIVRGLTGYAASRPGVRRISDVTAIIEQCDRDVAQAVYEDVSPADVIGDLAAAGDLTTIYEAGVDEAGRVVFRRPDAVSQLVVRRWRIDAADVQIEQSLDNLVNAVYARYTNQDRRALRTADQVDAASQERYGVSRQGSVQSDAATNAMAAGAAIVALDASSDPIPRASFRVRRICTREGAPVPLWIVRPGDIMVIDNISAVAEATAPGITEFRIAEVRYDVIGDVVEITPATSTPSTEHQQAAIARAAAWAEQASQTPGAVSSVIVPPVQIRRSFPPPDGPINRV